MKRGGILNPAICSLLAELGHQDELLIVDAGYALPPDSHVIDLTLTPGIPRFLDVLRAIAKELVIEGVTVAAEMHEYSPELLQEIRKTVGMEVDVEEEPHHEFQEQSVGVKGVIRTGEFTPYASARILCGSAF
jgi:D-ribose pyranase